MVADYDAHIYSCGISYPSCRFVAVLVFCRVLISECSPGPHYYQHPCVGFVSCLLFLA